MRSFRDVLEPAGDGNAPLQTTWLGNVGAAGVLALGFFAISGIALFALSREAPGLPVIVSALVLASILTALMVIDLKAHRLPDTLTLPLLAAGLVATWVLGDHLLNAHFIGAATAYLVLAAVAVCYRYLRGRVGLGGGDMKLFAAGGAWVGVHGLPGVLLIAAGSALVAVLARYLLGHATTARTRIAFGPFLAVGIWFVWLFQRTV